VLFTAECARDFETATTLPPADYRLFEGMNSPALRAPNWIPPSVELGAGDDYQRSDKSDFPYLASNVLLLREKAVNALADMLLRHGELLPVRADDGSAMQLYHTTCFVDALNRKASEIRYFDSGRIMGVWRAVLLPEPIAGLDAFRLSSHSSPLYVSQSFKDRVEAAKLKGLVFEACTVHD
jgi:hypothetical protein